ncbi:MAG: serine/threonine protein kinase [Planctomycetes bacterium]|nr:serine/threonine protein kinase [Planctomycetota bacterium]
MTSPSSTDTLQPGAIVAGRYRIVALLGRGGMGEVYRADDLELGQTLALKFLPAALARDAQALERLRAELRHARQVSHPHVCRLHDIGAFEQRPFLSMEFIDGEDLARLLRRIGQLPETKALEVARQLCAGLQAAHDRGVIHRDLKPANVMIDGDGRARITDFGLAIAAASGSDDVAGTPAYLAPELFHGAQASVASDVYALGLVLYELFCGAAPFRANTLAEWLRAHTSEEPTSPSLHAPQLDAGIEALLVRCLAKDPASRPRSAREVALALPGLDPLAIAVAEGRTPSPELVAASMGPSGLTRRTAQVLVGAIATLFVLLALAEGVNLHRRAPFEMPVAVLDDRARAILHELAGPGRVADHAQGFTFDTSWLDWTGDPRPAPERWERLRSGQPPVYSYWRRESPIPLQAATIWNDGEVAPDDPPITEPGEAFIRLDLRGRLLAYTRFAGAGDGEPTGHAPTDWSRCFAAAGLDPARMAPSAPERSHALLADEHVAWTGRHADHEDLPLRIEAAAWRGRPVAFEIVSPWGNAGLDGAPADGGASRAAALVGVSILAILLLGTVRLVRRNLALRRADRRGAWRLAAFTGLVAIAGLALRADPPATLGGVLTLLVEALQRGLTIGALAWLAYVALEPTLRSRQPHLVVSWTRALAGDLRNPLVGRDLLLGVVLGLLLAATRVGSGWLKDWTGNAYPPNHFVHGGVFEGLRYALATALGGGLLFGILAAFAALLFVTITRRVLRRPGLAEAALIAAICALQILLWLRSWPAILAVVLGMTLVIVTLSRLGLLAGATLFVVSNLATTMPLGFDFTAPYGEIAFVPLAGIALITWLGHRAAARQA